MGPDIGKTTERPAVGWWLLSVALQSESIVTLRAVTVPAIDRSALDGLEGHRRLDAAACADRVKGLALTLSATTAASTVVTAGEASTLVVATAAVLLLCLALLTAVSATLGVIRETAFKVARLIFRTVRELRAAVSANDCPVFGLHGSLSFAFSPTRCRFVGPIRPVIAKFHTRYAVDTDDLISP